LIFIEYQIRETEPEKIDPSSQREIVRKVNRQTIHKDVIND